MASAVCRVWSPPCTGAAHRPGLALRWYSTQGELRCMCCPCVLRRRHPAFIRDRVVGASTATMTHSTVTASHHGDDEIQLTGIQGDVCSSSLMVMWRLRVMGLLTCKATCFAYTPVLLWLPPALLPGALVPPPSPPTTTVPLLPHTHRSPYNTTTTTTIHPPPHPHPLEHRYQDRGLPFCYVGYFDGMEEGVLRANIIEAKVNNVAVR